MNTVDYHIPVLLKETVELLVQNKHGAYLDCTLGGGGHAKAILENLEKDGFLLGIDRDKTAIEHTDEALKKFPNYKSENISFSKVNELDQIVFGMKFDGILLDLGVSSKQIDDHLRGFSYSGEGNLDMRMNTGEGLTAYDIVNTYGARELTEIFYKFGEERNSRKIAERIVQLREKKSICTTMELSNLISSVIPRNFRVKTLSRIFQALRIEVNKELDELNTVLKLSLDILKPEGRVAVISYHSLEDRIVKKFIAEYSTGCDCPKELPRCVCNKKPIIKAITKKPVCATEKEIIQNSRARSAKLRVFEKI
ncbi:MAG: 16S rRNA (cytosine(1402)-N(4))-methyltransferase RsmH [Candidatus Delongbacteria bacterium]|nr:16S rRNA (cytosine(1402)-N(4))-methyltransferase RsmH [Candidatus Delongbacteria bacterium]MCG2761417.1 16S rRNA (cytosine(1402)-N(4))-methyltransferase RsmH [Candidatus Delongbacteria bacterium]